MAIRDDVRRGRCAPLPPHAPPARSRSPGVRALALLAVPAFLAACAATAAADNGDRPVAPVAAVAAPGPSGTPPLAPRPAEGARADDPAARGDAAAGHAEARRALTSLPRADEVYHRPDGSFVDDAAERRRALAQRLGPGVVWLEAPREPELERFYQQDDVWYLSQVHQPDIALALRVDEDGRLADEVLLLPAYDESWETWNGSRLTPGPAACEASGFRRTASLEERAALLAEWAPKTVWALDRPAVDLPAGAELDTGRLRRELDALRLTKSMLETECLKAAIDITGAALFEAAALVRPGAFEYEAQGALEGAFLRLGAERPGFSSIFGSGPNSVTLHYSANDRRMQDGELIVMDVGAKYRGYSADVTRTIPVGGRFSPRQREVYEAVLAAQTAAFEAARPGVTMRELDGIARKVIGDRGFGYGRERFMHGLGHWIGLDVHDVGSYGPIMPGMVFTIEPGVYIREENLGVRIEDDYLMTENGAIRLSTSFPSDPDAIEALLGAR